MLKNEHSYYILRLLIIGLVVKLFFILFFHAFQHEQIFLHTLGKVAQTYENTGTDILLVNKPFTKPTNENMNNWDAAHYYQIKSHLYRVSNEDNIHEQKSFAFFPLFPLLWRFLQLDFRGIAIVNYILFVVSLILLFFTFYKRKGDNSDFLVFGIVLLFPFTIVFHMPYTEALFLFTCSLLFYALIKAKYALFFIAAFLCSAVKPAITITMAAIVCTDVLFYLIHARNIKLFLKEVCIKVLPFLAGFFAAALYQYQFTDDFFKFMKTQHDWEHHFRIPDKIADWSVEGFGISVFAIFFVVLPAIYMLFRFTFNTKINKQNGSLFTADLSSKIEYVYYFCIIHFIGVFSFIFFFQGGLLNGLQRYILASPFLYVWCFISLNKLSQKPKSFKIKYLVAAGVLGFSFLLYVNKLNGWKMGFSHAGFFISVWLVSLLLFLPKGKLFNGQYVLLLLAFFSSLVFLTYMFNQYICSGWIFT